MQTVGTDIYLGNTLMGTTYVGDTLTLVNPYQYGPSPAPNIVTDGLIIYMDSTNPVSYPGSGTNLYNLVEGQNYTGSLSGGITYTGGYLTSNGTTSPGYIDIPNGTNTLQNTFTYMGASRFYGTTQGRLLSSAEANWLLGSWQSTTENYYAEGWISPVGAGATDFNWRVYAGTGDRGADDWKLYVNGVLTYQSGGGAYAPGTLRFGAGHPGDLEYGFGQLGFVLFYNRVLTDAEVLQNYNALKSKVGL
jgi:hypothetical protein